MNETNPPAVDEANRRPIAARRFAVFQSMTRWLAARGVTPNAISTFGMFAGIGAGGALAATRLDGFAMVGFLLAPALIGLRLLCNMLDGMVAVESGTSSKLGEVFNEVPDRVSDAATLVGAGSAIGGHQVLGLTAALLAVLVAYVRSVGVNAGASQQFQGPMAKQQRMLVVGIASIVAAFDPRQPVTIDGSLSGGVMTIALAVIVAGCVVTILRRLGGIARDLRETN